MSDYDVLIFTKVYPRGVENQGPYNEIVSIGAISKRIDINI